MEDSNPFEFQLDDDTRETIADIVGLERVECVEDAILVYLVKRRFYQGRPSITDMTKGFVEVRRHIAAINALLDNTQSQDYLLKQAIELFSVEECFQLSGTSMTFLNRSGGLVVREHLEALDKVCEASINNQPNLGKKGAPVGVSDPAIYSLLNGLCSCCEYANGGPITLKSGNTLERLVKALNEPLGLGGVQPGRVNTVIKNREKSREEKEH